MLCIIVVLLCITTMHCKGLESLERNESDISHIKLTCLLGVFSCYKIWNDWHAQKSFNPGDDGKPLGKDEYPWINEFVTRLAKKAYIKTPKVYLVHYYQAHGKHLSACVMGTEPTLFLSQDLIDELSPDELEAVIAHEISHMQYRHILFRIPRNAFIEALLIGLVLSSCDLISSWLKNALPSERQQRILWQRYAFWFVSYYFLLLTERAYQRHEELCADNGAVKLTQKPAALVSALKQIRAKNNWRGPVTLWQQLLQSHPQLSTRVRMLKKLLKSTHAKRTLVQELIA